MKYIINLVIIMLCISLSNNVVAQDATIHKTKEIFFGPGMVAYKGDLGNKYRAYSLSAVLGIKLNTARKWNSNFNLTFGKVSGQALDYVVENDPSATPNTFFSTSFFSFNYDLQYNFIDRPKLKIYISQGIGLIRYAVKDQFSNVLQDQSSTRALGEDYRNLTIMLPTQLGFKYILPNGFGVGLQGGYYNIMTDYIDNISQWGNKDSNDNLFSVRFQLSIPLKSNK